MNEKEAQGKLERALERFCHEQEFLLKHDLHERTIAHHLANYLHSQFTGWDVDCEYNRDGLERPKKLGLNEYEPTVAGATKSVTVYPDIIVHHRGQGGSEHNLLVLELKKSSNPDDGERDARKLAAFREQLEYQNAFALRLNTDGSMDTRWHLTRH